MLNKLKVLGVGGDSSPLLSPLGDSSHHFKAPEDVHRERRHSRATKASERNRTHTDAGCLIPAVLARRAGKCLMLARHCPQLAVPRGWLWDGGDAATAGAGRCRTPSDSAVGRVYSCEPKDREGIY